MANISEVANILVQFSTCATCGTSGTNFKVAVPQQEIMEMLRKLTSIVFQAHTIQKCNQNLCILNTFVIIRYKYIISKLSSQ